MSLLLHWRPCLLCSTAAISARKATHASYWELWHAARRVSSSGHFAACYRVDQRMNSLMSGAAARQLPAGAAAGAAAARAGAGRAPPAGLAEGHRLWLRAADGGRQAPDAAHRHPCVHGACTLYLLGGVRRGSSRFFSQFCKTAQHNMTSKHKLMQRCICICSCQPPCSTVQLMHCAAECVPPLGCQLGTARRQLDASHTTSFQAHHPCCVVCRRRMCSSKGTGARRTCGASAC